VGASSYFPYGETRGGGSGFQFATYRRDSATQFDYAQQRYYASKVARFLTPDPWGGSAGPWEPHSFNRYGYVKGDPVNHNDPLGLATYGLRFVGGGLSLGGTERLTFCDIYWEEWFCSPLPFANGRPGEDAVISRASGQKLSPAEKKSERATVNMWNAIAKALQVLQQNATCAGLFGGTDVLGNATPDPVTFLYEMAAGEDARAYFEVGHIVSKPGVTTSATTSPTGGTVTVDAGNGATQSFPILAVTINDLEGDFLGGNSNAQVATILHELGHVYDDLFGPNASLVSSDSGDIGKSEANQAAVKEACGL
jgi:RHS repeat-associated protein